jgi:hypothetical protein
VVASVYGNCRFDLRTGRGLSPWLPVTDSGTTLWTGFFTNPIQTAGLAHTLEVQAAYTTGFLVIAAVHFARRDVFN